MTVLRVTSHEAADAPPASVSSRASATAARRMWADERMAPASRGPHGSQRPAVGDPHALTRPGYRTHAATAVSQGQVRPAVASDDVLAALDATVARARASRLYAERLAGVRVRTLDDLRALPVTTREDLQRAGPHGTRAAPMAEIVHYGESSGTSGATNSTWLTAADLERDAHALRARHPDVFGAGRIVLNRFPFMAAPAHLIQLIAQQGGGVAIPAGNINWDVP